MTEEEFELVLHPEIKKWRKEQEVDESLMRDIEDKGQLENLVARRRSDGKVELIAGYRRYLAMLTLGKEPWEMDIKILDDVSDRQALLMALSENQQRKDMSPVEEARAFRSMEKIMSVEDIAEVQGRSDTYVRNRLELLELPEQIQEMMDKGELLMSYAKPLNRLAEFGSEAQMQLVDSIHSGSWGSVATVEDAHEFVDKLVEEVKHKKELVAKYGVCPDCGSKNINDEAWEDDKLQCDDCSHSWHKETQDPWEFYKLKQKAEEMGLELDIGEGTAKLTAADVTDLMKKMQGEAEMEEGEEIPGTIRSDHTVLDLLTPFLTPHDVYRFTVDGDKITINLVQESNLYFTARKHDYKSGEKTQIKVRSKWDREQAEVYHNLQQFLQSLEPE